MTTKILFHSSGWGMGHQIMKKMIHFIHLFFDSPSSAWVYITLTIDSLPAPTYFPISATMFQHLFIYGGCHVQRTFDETVKKSKAEFAFHLFTLSPDGSNTVVKSIHVHIKVP